MDFEITPSSLNIQQDIMVGQVFGAPRCGRGKHFEERGTGVALFTTPACPPKPEERERRRAKLRVSSGHSTATDELITHLNTFVCSSTIEYDPATSFTSLTKVTRQPTSVTRPRSGLSFDWA